MKDNVTISSKLLYQFIIQSYRYAFNRDNHLAPQGFVDDFKSILEELKESDYYDRIVDQLIAEIYGDLLFYDEIEYEQLWLDFANYLQNLEHTSPK